MSSTTFQDAKDTFYLALRDRLITLNPDRTVVVRGATRPGVLVEENETALPGGVDGFFLLRWIGYAADASGPLPLLRGQCQVRYRTRGLPEVAGMDRGRTLQAMDEELQAMLMPAFAPLMSYGGPAPVAGVGRVFWGDAAFGEASVQGDALERVATIEVFTWKEAL